MAFWAEAATLSAGMTFPKLGGVAEIFGTARGFFVANEVTNPNEPDREAIEQAGTAAGPSRLHVDPGNRGNEINPVRLGAELNHLVSLAEVLAGNIQTAKAKRSERGEHGIGVVRNRPHEDIDVRGEPRIPVPCHRIRANDQIINSVRV